MQLWESFPLYRAGIPKRVEWTAQGVLVITSLGTDVLDSATLQKIRSLPLLQPVMRLESGEWLFCGAPGWQQVNLDTGAHHDYDLELPGCSAFGSRFALSADETYYAEAVDAATLLLTNLSNGMQRSIALASQTRLKFQLSGLRFSPDSSLLYALLFREDGYGELVGIFSGRGEEAFHLNGVTQMPLFSVDGSRMLYRGLNNLEVHLSANGSLWQNIAPYFYTQLTTRQAALFTARHMAFTPRGDIAILYSQEVRNRTEQVSSLSSSVIVYDGNSGKALQTLNGLPALVEGFAVAPDGAGYLTLTGDGVLRRWNAADLTFMAQSAPYEPSPAPALSPDATRLAFAAGQFARLVDVRTGQILAEVGSYPNALRVEPAFAGNLRLALTVQTPWQAWVDIIDLQSGELVQTFADMRDCIFSAGGAYMACARKFPSVYALESGAVRLRLEENEGWGSPALDSGGVYAAFCQEEEKSVAVWELATRQQVARFSLPEGSLCGPMQFSPHAELLAGGGWVYALAESRMQAQFDAEPWQPLVFTPDGRLLVAFPALVNPLTGAEAARLAGEGGMESLFWTTTGGQLAVRYADRLELWSKP